jgi:hypothetical protein
MNLTGRPPYQKGTAKKKRNVRTEAQKKRWDSLVHIGCILNRMNVPHECRGRITIHHLFTGAGGRKNHDLVAPLCANMHIGSGGIDGRQKLSKRAWQETYCTEAAILAAVEYEEAHPF